MKNHQVYIVKRNSIAPLCQIETTQGNVEIGKHRQFKKNPILNKLLPSDAKYISIAWTSLLPGQMLPVHKHPVDSIIIICEGIGKYIGEYDRNIESGDVIYVQSNALHGFQASDEEEMHCLSIQFESQGLYEKKENALVEFGSMTVFDLFIKNHNSWLNKFSILSNLIVHDLETKGGEYKIRLLQTLKRWSNIFQHILFARQIHTLDKEIYDLFKLHLIDEFGHDNFFSDFIYDFDPKLEGYFSWFINQMSILPDNEKLIVTNLVLESAANIFYSKFSKKCEENKNINQYIDLHNQLDKDHASLGMENIRKYCFENQISANSILDSSWKMFISMFSRIREISLGSDDDLSFLDENRTPSKTRKS